MARGAKVSLIVAAILMGLLSAGMAGAQAKGRWSRCAPLAKGWEEVMGVALRGKLYIYEGLQAYPGGITGQAKVPEWKPYGRIEVYDPGSNTWTAKSRMPQPTHHVAVAAHGDKIYFFGGYVSPEPLGGWSSVANVWMYDPDTDKWTPRHPMPTPRGGAHAVEVGGKIYVIGGSASTAHLVGSNTMDLRAVEEYDPEKDSWRMMQPMFTPRNHHAVGAIGGKIYVVGGRVGAPFVFRADHLRINEEFDPVRNTWAWKAAMPTPRSGLGFAVLGGKLFVFGGERPPNIVHGEVEAYNPATDKWESYAPMPTPRHAPATAAVGNKIYVVSGNVRTGGGSESPICEVLEPEPAAMPAPPKR